MMSLVEEKAVARASTVDPVQPFSQLAGAGDDDDVGSEDNGNQKKNKKKKTARAPTAYNLFIAEHMKDQSLFAHLPHNQKFKAIIELYRASGAVAAKVASKPKASGAVVAKAASKPKAAAAAKAKGKKAAPPTVAPPTVAVAKKRGCSKCRYLPGGCGQCNKHHRRRIAARAALQMVPPAKFQKYADDYPSDGTECSSCDDEQGSNSLSSEDID